MSNCSRFVNILFNAGALFLFHLNVLWYLLLFYSTGLSIYIFYGLRHSVEGQRQQEQEGYVPLEQIDGKDDQEGDRETTEPKS